MKTLLHFQNLKTELKNLVSVKSYGFLKLVQEFSIFAQKNADVNKIM